MPPLSLYSTQPRSMETPKGAQGLAQVSIQPQEVGRQEQEQSSFPKELSAVIRETHYPSENEYIFEKDKSSAKIPSSFQFKQLTELWAKSGLPPVPQRLLNIVLNTLQKMSFPSLLRSSRKVFFLWSLVKTITTCLMKNHPQLHKKHDIPIDP